jgi:hypothetical protein
MKANADLVGKKVRCKQCQNVFPVVAPKAAAGKPGAGPTDAPAGGKTGHADDFIDRNPYTMLEENLAARCPHCAQPLDPPDSVICLHCGYHMRKRERVESKQTYERTFGDYLMWHLPTIGCFFGIVALIGFDVFVGFSAEVWLTGSWLDNGDGDFIVKPSICTVWSVVITMFPIWKMAKLIFKRIFYNFTPPERVKIEKEE